MHINKKRVVKAYSANIEVEGAFEVLQEKWQRRARLEKQERVEEKVKGRTARGAR